MYDSKLVLPAISCQVQSSLASFVLQRKVGASCVERRTHGGEISDLEVWRHFLVMQLAHLIHLMDSQRSGVKELQHNGKTHFCCSVRLCANWMPTLFSAASKQISTYLTSLNLSSLCISM